MRAHGASGACRKARVVPRCDICREWDNAAQRRAAQTPGTYRYNQIHGVGQAGWDQQDRDRNFRRAEQAAKDEQRLAQLRGGK